MKIMLDDTVEIIVLSKQCLL